MSRKRSSRKHLNRREFITRSAALAMAGAGVPVWIQAATAPQRGAASANSPSGAIDLAEWSYFWVGVERVRLARGTMVGGRQMYVEYWTPAQVRHPYPVVFVHGGGGQGTDWMGTPDGRPGWVTYMLQEGYKVYVVDRPGHGRSPFHPDLHGAFPQQQVTLENISGRFTPPNSSTRNAGPYQHLHTQWPGTGEIGSVDLDQFVAGQGGSYVAAPPGPVAPPVDGGVAGGNETQHMVWRRNGVELVDKVGPVIFITNSAGGPFGWLVAEVRPNLVKGIVSIEGGGTPFTGQNIWGLSTIPVAYDPPVSEPSEIKTTQVTSAEMGVQPYRLQEAPARKLKNIQNIPVAFLTGEASFAAPGNPGAVEYLKQAGCKAEELRLGTLGIHGNGHVNMLEKNNRQTLQPVLDWLEKNVNGGRKTSALPSPAKKDSTAMKLGDWGLFWVGTQHKKVQYGTILTGQMYVQYLIPAQVRHPYPVVLVHGGTGQMLHYMGAGDGLAGWAHYYVQEGYRVYLIDRPGHGRSPYHPDALGPIGPQPTYTGIVAEFKRASMGPNRQWSGTGEIGDPLVDQFMASQNGAQQDQAAGHRLWASRGAELLDKIGPSVIQVHSAGGPFGYLVANERPTLVKAIVNVEGGAGIPFSEATPWGITTIPLAFDPPVSDPSQLATRDVTTATGTYKLQAEPARKLKNLAGIPIVYVTAEKSGRNGEPQVAFLKQAGCDAEELRLKDKGILGNGHFMMIENNRRLVFDVIRGWLESKTV